MGVETWYRGEGVGVPAAKPLGAKHDLTDGVYFADTERVAMVYATERAGSPLDRRVYKLPIDTGTGKFLDLTTHPAWQKSMDMKMSDGRTIQDMLKGQPSSQQYEAMFVSFVKNNKIDLDKYDGVIGPEFRNGGKQLCIFNKGGQPAPLVAKLRALFIPIRSTPVSSTPGGSMRFGGKIGPGLRGVGGQVGGFIALLGLQLLVDLLNRRNRKVRLDDEMKRLTPEIDTQIRSHTNEVAELLSTGRKAFANITMTRIERTINTGVGGFSTTVPELPKLQFDGVEIGDKPISVEDREIVEERKFNFDNVVEHHRSTYPVELTLSQQEVDLFAAFKKELLWYEATLKDAPSGEDIARLSKDKMALEAKFRAAFTN